MERGILCGELALNWRSSCFLLENALNRIYCWWQPFRLSSLPLHRWLDAGYTTHNLIFFIFSFKFLIIFYFNLNFVSNEQRILGVILILIFFLNQTADSVVFFCCLYIFFFQLIIFWWRIIRTFPVKIVFSVFLISTAISRFSYSSIDRPSIPMKFLKSVLFFWTHTPK